MRCNVVQVVLFLSGPMLSLVHLLASSLQNSDTPSKPPQFAFVDLAPLSFLSLRVAFTGDAAAGIELLQCRPNQGRVARDAVTSNCDISDIFGFRVYP